jgi:hypothetical protein
MTVSEALAAHAGAQIAAAKHSDLARQVMTPPLGAKSEARSFIESWSVAATVIGWRKERD